MNDHRDLGVVVAALCRAPLWDECKESKYCKKEKQDGGCRWCQTYQLYWGLDPTCGDKGIPEKTYWSMHQHCTRTDEELKKLVDLQKLMREKYRSKK